MLKFNLKSQIKSFYNIWFIQLVKRAVIILYNAYLIPFFFNYKFKKLSTFKNCHKNRRVFIVATGPSLTIDDLNLIKGEISFSVNSIYKVFDKTDWRPDYYGIVDSDVFRRIKDELVYVKLNSVFYPHNYIKWSQESGFAVPLRQGIGYNAFIRKIIPKRFWTSSLSTDISKLVYEGTSVVHFLMQIVFYMGFKEVYLIGTDCNYFCDSKHNSLVKYKGSDNLSNSAEDIYKGLMDDYRLALEYANKNGIKIFNASRGGMLEMFPRVQLEQVLMSQK